ncbi:MAG: sensor histidine kinase [Pseudozobellia sp.]|nr:sensor histidine kinase [Pseudozobellia sp.]|tara:strand:+ start:5324 stop:6346 length:1023 start_codon:yes stop_codon:yes gene_type:complete
MVLEKFSIKSILAHVAVWGCFTLFLLYPSITEGRRTPSDIPAKLCLTIALFYVNYFLLVPHFLLKKKTVLYISLSILLLFITTYVSETFFRPQFIDHLPRIPRGPKPEGFRQPLIFILLFCVPFVVSTILKVYGEWKSNDDLRKVTEKEKINSELQFLKTQLNPHFLFNSLNTIYSLSVKNSSDTSEAILNISELMRYMLYEANREKVPLEKEINYLKNYVQLQRLRLPEGESVKLKINGNTHGKLIDPLLFIAFIENAFKYGTDFQGNTDIEINLEIKEQSISLNVANIIGAYVGKEGSSGVGIENVKNRLKLLYPKTHELTIEDDGKYYRVHLFLNLN